MSEAYLDLQLIHNSSLACFLLTHFIGQYQDAASGQTPDLSKLMLVLPLAWSESSREELSKRNARSALAAVLRESPVLKIDLQQRVAAHAGATLQGLNLAVSTRLIGKVDSTATGVRFQVLVDRWPRGIKNTIPTAMMQTTERLAKWFATESTENLYKLLFGIPNEIHD
ncbi:DUF6521 family protein [Pseudomonas sp. SL4(2022)]|uniref:three component ABC system middle component n=1 Tax=Pseudomonas sp. SL4(2022) TaxID=2994661 RepID=UPI00226FC704|nr:three component ABC system middle component [Pseudomonas sp. SL4(2022)]WAC44614.1 DUF6521 family protein [Pseudomonas sp. SL4(2022)]